MSGMGLEESWEGDESSFYIVNTCYDMDPTASALNINPTSSCLTIITSSIDKCRLRVVVVSCPAVAPKTGGQTRHRAILCIQGLVPPRSFVRLFHLNISLSRQESSDRFLMSWCCP